MNLAKYILIKSKIMLVDAKTKKRLLVFPKDKYEDHLKFFKNIKIRFPLLTEGENLRPFFFKEKSTRYVQISFEELQRYGFVILSIPIGGARWFKGQSVCYILHREKNPIIPGSQILHYCPELVVIEKDLFKGKIRLRGQNCGPTSFGKWKMIQNG